MIYIKKDGKEQEATFEDIKKHFKEEIKTLKQETAEASFKKGKEKTIKDKRHFVHLGEGAIVPLNFISHSEKFNGVNYLWIEHKLKPIKITGNEFKKLEKLLIPTQTNEQ